MEKKDLVTDAAMLIISKEFGKGEEILNKVIKSTPRGWEYMQETPNMIAYVYRANSFVLK